jgi:hypothetical protein
MGVSVEVVPLEALAHFTVVFEGVRFGSMTVGTGIAVVALRISRSEETLALGGGSNDPEELHDG